MALPQMITNRTEEDVNHIRELTQKVKYGSATDDEWWEWLDISSNGIYKYTDLNRVGEALKYLSDTLLTYKYSAPVTAKRDWKVNDVPTLEDMNTYLADINSVRKALNVFKKTPTAPEKMQNLTYNKANDIEQIMIDMEELITKMKAFWLYSGEIYAGEV